jgi:hypothetical protein
MYAVLQREADLGESNYVLNPTPDHNYWVNISGGRLKGFIARCGEKFNIVIVGSRDDEGDFYAIPYPVVKQALADEFRSIDKTGRQRWVATIKSHQLKVGRFPVPIDVGAFYGCSAVLTSPGVMEPGTAADLNDYAIENRKIEIEQRQKQSLFRKRVLQNFGGRCCLSGISEEELLVASHIVPWAKRIDSRLDPANGLLLYDGLRVIVSPLADRFSSPLQAVLNQLVGQRARRPLKAIKSEYLAYHRAYILQRGSQNAHAAGTVSVE